MMTFSLNPRLIPRGADSFAFIRNGPWRKMRVALMRRLGTFAFITILEAHKSNVAHLHVLINAFIPQRWLEAKWKRFGGGHCGIKRVEPRYAAAYLNKDEDLPPGVRQVTTSRGLTIWPRSRAERGSGVKWILSRAPIELHRRVAPNVRAEGFQSDADGAIILAWFVAGRAEV